MNIFGRMGGMAIYKIVYYKECEHTMEVEAGSEEEAMKKYEDFDCIRDYESQGIIEKVLRIIREGGHGEA
jgi:hypothetical protein